MKKIRKFIDNLINWYTSLVGVKKLFVTIILVVILAIMVYLISLVDFSKKTIDYSELNIENVVANCEISNDRQIYIKSNDIIGNLLLTTAGRYNIDGEKVSISDYYKYTLFSEYKISKSKFKKKIKNISEDLFNGLDSSTVELAEIYPIIKNIYVYSEDYDLYVVELNTINSHAIGLKFYDNNAYHIFYVE